MSLLYVESRQGQTPEVRFLMDTDFPSKLTHFRESKVEAYPYLKSLPVYRYRADS
jgi:hypothetical protein